MSMLALDKIVEISPLHRLQWEEAQQSYVLLYPEGMISLNPSAGEILKRVDGTSPLADIVRDLEATFPGADLRQDVLEFMEVAHAKGWIRTRQAR